jgi:subtilisin family serine protease
MTMAGTTTEYSVGYASVPALRAAVARQRATIERRIAPLRLAEVRARSFVRAPGIRFVQRVTHRVEAAEPVDPALAVPPGQTTPWEWQFTSAGEDAVPSSVLRAAASVTIAVIDTGADLDAPDLAAKSPLAFNTRTGTTDVRDTFGHGTFVAALAAGSVTNGEGMAGFGGDAKLLVIKTGPGDGSFTDVDEATAVTYAVDHGARIINLSLGGTTTSATERAAVDYAASHGVLIVAAAGNDYLAGNPVIYPAGLVQPVGSNGSGGTGLAVAASDSSGSRAVFSSTGSYISLAAPGEDVFSAVSSASPSRLFPRVSLPGSAGLYGYASGTSFAAPEVAGAAALVMAANPRLDALGVAQILKSTASGHGAWSPEVGYGVIDVSSAVALAAGTPPPPARSTLTLDARLAGARVTLAGALASLVPAVAVRGRGLAFDVFRGGSWKRVGKTQTRADGKATLSFPTRRAGVLKLRARWPGASDLAPALSKTVAVSVARSPRFR